MPGTREGFFSLVSSRAASLLGGSLVVSLCLAGCATAGEDDPDPVPDARPPGVDAAPLTDAAPPADGPGPGTDGPPGCTNTQLLQNPAFDVGPSSWDEDATVAIITQILPSGTYAHSGSFVASLGLLILTTERLSQDVAIPAGTTDLTLSGQRWILTNEGGGSVYDTMVISIRDTGGTTLETLRTFSNLDAGNDWAVFNETITGSYAGQTIRVYVEASNDFSDVTTFLIDSMALQATVCQ